MRLQIFSAVFLILFIVSFECRAEEEGKAPEANSAETEAKSEEPKKESLTDKIEFKGILGGQGVVFINVDDDSPHEKDLTFSVNRMTIYGWANFKEVASIKIQLASAPKFPETLGLNLADLQMDYKPFSFLNFRLGRYKKAYTRVYTPSWFTHEFFNVPESFKYLQKHLGLAGRGSGLAAYGKFLDGAICYFVGGFNGLEEAKPQSDGYYSSEGFQPLGRLEFNILKIANIGLGATYLYKTKFHEIIEGETEERVVDSNLVSYAGSVAVNIFNLTLSGEYIGFSVLKDNGKEHGGGLHVEALYNIHIPIGYLQPGLRYARFWPDVTKPVEDYVSEVTGLFNWWANKNVRLGLEVGNRASKIQDENYWTLLMQMVFLYGHI